MPSIPQIQIRQQYGQIGIETINASQEMVQPNATYEVNTTPPQVDIHSPRGELIIDQSKAWDALGSGGILEAMTRIYTQSSQVALQGIGKKVEEGNRLAAIHLGGNPIADIGQEEAYAFHEFDYYGEASSLNVKIDYIPHKVEINVTDGHVNINTHPNKPEVTYHPGKVNISMLQWPKVEIIPPQIDMKV
ncbi:DUF6470 family protein [Paenibacillus andongensis]|uniref:DUF6470 family protein n=1 Tax=Paenibacillus andongensis TaxID=2975482 RepID=UPI0021BB4998|nr:DUF6470 family protein [Paenibacillus andongensis]